MSHLVTLGRQHPKFRDHLLGRVDGFRPIPIRTISPDSSAEMITFKMVHASDIDRPFAWWLKTLRLPTLLEVILPLLVVFSMIGTTVVDPLVISAVTLGILSFFVSAFLFNDYQDHMRGLDRISLYRGNRVIQNGWVSALSVRTAAAVMFGLSLIMAGLVFFLTGTQLVSIGLVVLFFTALYFVDKFGLRNRASREFIDFLLFGPILANSFEYALVHVVSLEVFAFGVVWGLLIAQHHFIHRFSQCMFFEKVGFHTLTRRLGFEKSRLTIQTLYLMILAAIFFYATTVGKPPFVLLFIYLLFLPFLFGRLSRIQSPVSSGFAKLSVLNRWMVLAVGFGFLLSEPIERLLGIGI